MAGLVDIAATGDRRATLEALRQALAESIAGAEPANVAALAKQLRETVAELDSLPRSEVVSPVDQLRARRAARRTDAEGEPSSGQRRQRRPRGAGASG